MFTNKSDKQKQNRSADNSQIFVNNATGKTYFIKQNNDGSFSINGEDFIKRPQVITITRKVVAKDNKPTKNGYSKQKFVNQLLTSRSLIDLFNKI